jgi:DNA-binding transcriptional LysR family regulator
MAEPDLNLLIALDVLLSDGSVAGAARRLGLSASAMSRTLTRLRETTGDPLLVRAGRKMVLTPHAEALRQRTKGAVEEAQSLLLPSTAALDLATLQREFIIRTNEGFVEQFGASLIAAAGAEAPRVRFRFAPKPDKTDMPLREGSIDLEIGVLGEMGPEVRLQALFRDHFIAVVRKGHPLQKVRKVNAKQYVAFGHVVASRRGAAHGPVDDALATLGLARTVVAVVPGFPAALAIARASDLIALVPSACLWHHDAASLADTLHAFALPVSTGTFTVSQLWHPRLEADPAHRWLRQLVLRVCQRHAPPEPVA